MLNFLHTNLPKSILLNLGFIKIYWYGFLIAIGAIIAITITIKLAKYYNIKKKTIINLSFYLIIFGIIGARIYHILLELPYYIKYPINSIKIWEGGLAIHGGIIAGIITIYFFTKKIKIDQLTQWQKIFLFTSIIVPGLALAQAIGRWGNYFNQELFGTPTNLSWGIPINIFNRPLNYLSATHFHPTFLYESLGNLSIFLILIAFHAFAIKRKKINTKYCLIITICYIALYSILRFFLEFIRIDHTLEILGLRTPQIISLFIILIIIITLIINIILKKLHFPKNTDTIK